MPGILYPVRLMSIELQIRATGRVRGLSAIEIGALRYWSDVIMEDIEDGTPVDTGFLRDSWEVELHTDADLIGFDIINDADYADYVHPKGDPAPLWTTLIPEVIARHRTDMLRDLSATVRRTEEAMQRAARPADVLPAGRGMFSRRFA